MIIGIAGAIVGQVVKVRPHPRGDLIWLADVDLGNGDPPVQIVFGGVRKVIEDELVPVAPPGTWAFVQTLDPAKLQVKKMRARTYRGERSHGMLCSLDELGWMVGGPNEVAVLQNVVPGESIDDFPELMWPHLVAESDRAKEKRLGAMVYKAVPSAPLAPPKQDAQLLTLTPLASSTPPDARKVPA